MRAVASVWIAIFALIGCAPASACSWPDRSMTAAQVRAYAREQFAQASLVVDAEVASPMSLTADRGQLQVAFLRVIRRIKGPGDVEEVISVVVTSSCDIQLLKKGERVRILLSDGPNLFTASMAMQGPLTYRESAGSEFNAEIDRLAGGQRPSGFSAYPGELHSMSDIYGEGSNVVSLGPVKALADRGSNIGAVLIGIGAGLLTFFGLALVSLIRRGRKEKA